MAGNDDVDLLRLDVQAGQRIQQVAVAKAPQPPGADASVQQNRLALALDDETQHARGDLRGRVLVPT